MFLQRIAIGLVAAPCLRLVSGRVGAEVNSMGRAIRSAVGAELGAESTAGMELWLQATSELESATRKDCLLSVHGNSMESISAMQRCIGALQGFAEKARSQRMKSLTANRKYAEDFHYASSLLSRLQTKHEKLFQQFNQDQQKAVSGVLHTGETKREQHSQQLDQNQQKSDSRVVHTGGRKGHHMHEGRVWHDGPHVTSVKLQRSKSNPESQSKPASQERMDPPMLVGGSAPLLASDLREAVAEFENGEQFPSNSLSGDASGFSVE